MEGHEEGRWNELDALPSACSTLTDDSPLSGNIYKMNFAENEKRAPWKVGSIYSFLGTAISVVLLIDNGSKESKKKKKKKKEKRDGKKTWMFSESVRLWFIHYFSKQ